MVGSVGNVIGSGGSAGLQNGVGDNQVGATFDTLAGIGLGSLSEGRYQSMPVHLPQPGSLLIDRGSDLAAQAAGLETDQLGFERFLDGDPLVNGTTPRVDIGAVEYNPAGLFSERVATEVFVDFTGLTEALNDLAVRAQLQDGSGGDFVFSNGDVSGIETKILNELANTFVEFEGISFTTAPPTGPHDTITFGETSLNPFVLGTSEGHAIDFRNIFGSAVGRVFTSSFAVVLNNTNFPPETNVAPQSPELDGLIVDLGVLLGGTGAHELIHTMGIQHYDAYGDPDITPAATGGAQNDYLIATGSTGLTATGRLASRVLSPLTKAKLEFAYGTTNVLPPDSIEDPATNSTATLATEIDLVGLPISGYAGANVLGELSTAGGSDWYRIDLSAGEDLSVNAISPTRTPFQIGVVDMGLRVYRDDGSTLTTPLAENKDLVYTANWIGDKGEVPPTEVVLFGGDYSGSVDDALALNIPITTSGSYLIEVFDPSNQGTGFYDLFVAAESSVTSPRVTDVTFIGMAGGVAAEVSMDARVALSQQLDNLALGSVTAVRIDFDLPIDAFQPSDLEVTALISEATATQPVVSGVSYDPAMTSATWTFNSSLPTNVFSLRVKDTLQSSGVALDGDWVNPSLPGEASGMATEITSGNNTPGSDFVFAFTALPADFNSDEVLDLLDLDVLGSNFGTTPATYLQGDANGDNSVDLLDLDLLGGNFGFAAFAESLAMLVASADYDGVNGTNEDDRDEFDSLFLAEDSLADLNGDGDFDSTDEALFDLFVDLNVS